MSVEKGIERCGVCGCRLHRGGGQYAKPTVEGRSHATKHHYVAQRFYGDSPMSKGVRSGIFEECPWGARGQTGVFCYECHEELLHNVVFLPEDVEGLVRLVRAYGLDEDMKTKSREKLAGRIVLLHSIIKAGIQALLDREGGRQ